MAARNPPTQAKKKYRNFWRSEWLDRTVHENRVGDFIQSGDEDGTAFCKACKKKLDFSSRGFIAIHDHMLRLSHQKCVAALKGNATMQGGSVEEELATTQKAHAPSCSSLPASTAPSKQEQKRPLKLTSLSHRLRNQEALTLAFAAENGISLATVPKLIDYAKTISRDPKAAQNLKMSRITAAYKLRFGLAKTLQDGLLEELRQSTFSLNIDEATSKTDVKVLTILVSHFSQSNQKLMVHHLSSLSLVKVTAESLFEKLSELFSSLKLPWENVLSIMMDSCNVMRGPKGGLEKLIRDRLAPQLLDVDGDCCHHAHNAARKFCSIFEEDWKVEGLLNDLHTDFKWCTEHKELLADICTILGIAPSYPKRYVPHRWLSITDVAVNTLHLFPALTVFYFSFLDKEDKKIYSCVIEDIFSGCQDKEVQSLKTIMNTLSKKSMTNDGKARKRRLTESVFTYRPQRLLVLKLFVAVLPCLQKYVKTFQSKSSQVHRLMAEQYSLLEQFFGLFVNPAALADEKKRLNKTGKPEATALEERCYLKTVNLDDRDNILPSSEIFVGTEIEKVLTLKVGEHHVVGMDIRKTFLKKLKQAYVLCGTYLQQKMPLENQVLKVCSALDPTERCKRKTCNLLLHIPALVTSRPDLQSDQFQQEVRAYNISQSLEIDPTLPIDMWWSALRETYPLLSEGALALLSCFHGPLVESSFSLMSEILDCHSARTSMETFSAIQSVRYHLSARDTTAVKYFGKKEPITEPVDRVLVDNMEKAYKINMKRQEENRQKKAEKRHKLGMESAKKSQEDQDDRKHDKAGKKRKSEASVPPSNKRPKYQNPKDKKYDLVEPGTSRKAPDSNQHAGDETQTRKTFFQDLSKKLQTAAKSSFYDLQTMAKKAARKIDTMMYKVNLSNLESRHYLPDKEAMALYPKDSPQRVPVQIYGDGNCFPRCCSVLASGTQQMHEEMRARIIIEQAVHEDFYLDSNNLHGPVSSSTDRFGQPENLAQIYATYSDQYMMELLTPHVVKQIYRAEVCKSVHPGSFMGIWQMHAAASVLNTPLVSVYPQLGGETVRKHLHRTLHPRPLSGIGSETNTSVVPAILWSRLDQGEKKQPMVTWGPNHFVVCVQSPQTLQDETEIDNTSAKSTPCSATISDKSRQDQKRKLSTPSISSFFVKKPRH